MNEQIGPSTPQRNARTHSVPPPLVHVTNVTAHTHTLTHPAHSSDCPHPNTRPAHKSSNNNTQKHSAQKGFEIRSEAGKPGINSRYTHVFGRQLKMRQGDRMNQQTTALNIQQRRWGNPKLHYCLGIDVSFSCVLVINQFQLLSHRITTWKPWLHQNCWTKMILLC
jgi:hypothetical protein